MVALEPVRVHTLLFAPTLVTAVLLAPASVIPPIEPPLVSVALPSWMVFAPEKESGPV